MTKYTTANGNTLCLYFQNNKLACSLYDSEKKCLFYLNELPESSSFELTNLIIVDNSPMNIITSARSEPKFIEFLKKKCGILDNDKHEAKSARYDDNSHVSDESYSDEESLDNEVKYH